MREKSIMSQRIRELRKASGLTQAQLASDINLKETAIRSYENGLREPNAKAMAALERYFQVSGEYLLGESDQRNAWDDKVAMTAIYDNLSTAMKRLEEAVRACDSQEQKLSFDILSELSHVVRQRDLHARREAVSLLHYLFVATTHFIDVCTSSPITEATEASRVDQAKRAALRECERAFHDTSWAKSALAVERATRSRIPFAASGEAGIMPESDDFIQDILWDLEKRSEDLKKRSKELKKIK